MDAPTTANKGSKIVAAATAAALAGALCLGGAATAFAAGEQVDEGSYGYRAAQLHVSDRMASSEDVAADADGSADSTGNAYADGAEYSYNAGAQRGASYADADHEDADALVEAGVIDSAFDIDAYAAAKHAEVSARFGGLDSMTAQERHEHFSQFSRDAYAGDTIEELEAEGLAE